MVLVLRDAVSSVYVHCDTLLVFSLESRMSAVYAGESSTNSVREVPLFYLKTR